MSAEPTAEDFSDAMEALGLPHPGLVEKDFHVVRALNALNNLEYPDVSLVFGGGTSLCRAYRLIDRMSEDIDLRIMSDLPLTSGGRSRFRGAVSQALLEAGFQFDPGDRSRLQVFDGGKSFTYNLPYASVAGAAPSLRANIKVEISSWPLQRSPVGRPVRSFLAQAHEGEPEISEILCVDVTETAADKFVALTRRVAQQRANGGARDHSLLRHIYDLSRIGADAPTEELTPILKAIMTSDQETRGKSFPAYAADPKSVSLSAIEALAEDETYAVEFDAFQRDMVYGQHVTLQDCLPILRSYAALI